MHQNLNFYIKDFLLKPKARKIVINEQHGIRNVAIIAHVDHGKTTLVDELLKQSGAFRENQAVTERIMDSNDLERERGITILSKNTSVTYNNVKINIVDTPGHADFGGEVERVLKMVNGVVLVVDAFEGSMPQTKFVLKNALDLKLPVVVCINKTDRPDARVQEVTEEVLELFLELEAPLEHLDSPFIYASAKAGTASESPDNGGVNFAPLFEAIINHIPAPTGDASAPFKMLISTIDYNDYVGRIGIGKIETGTIPVGTDAIIVNMHDPDKKDKVKISKLYVFNSLSRVEVKEASFGEIAALTGIDDIKIGDTVCDILDVTPLQFSKISEPTISINFIVNDSPFAGKEGRFVTGRQLRDRLFKELNTDVGLQIEETAEADAYKVSGRGELHLSILIENMRREGYEFQVSKPEVRFKESDGKTLEPMEMLTIDVPAEFSGLVIEKLGARRGELVMMSEARFGYSRLKFHIPSRSLIGYRTEFLTDTRGNGIMNAIFDGYEPYKGVITTRTFGSLVAFEDGTATSYGIYNAQERGSLFLSAGVNVYAGMVVGKSSRNEDVSVNVCKRKQLTNMRAAGSDDSLKISPPLQLSLEQALEFISNDELLEVTPKDFRIRKKILDHRLRLRAGRAE
ncbi:translation elongation factor-related [Holotrichia oblita]|nr:translation elongation factor-related [Holotrichia oblita]